MGNKSSGFAQIYESKIKLRLFVAGNSPRSSITLQVLTRLCEEHLRGVYDLEVVDIYQQPALAREAQIIATPTLVKYTPTPKKILIGDLSRTERVLIGLGVV
jgi:circadian clock protein KaiB